MTSRASRSVALLSYLSQELECAKLLVATQPAPVVREFYSLFLGADGWVHLNKYLSTEGRAGERTTPELVQSAALMREMLELAPQDEWARLKPAKKRVFELFARNRLDLLALLDESGNLGYSEPVTTLEAYQTIFDDTEQLRDGAWLDSGFMATALRDREIAPLLENARELDLELIEQLAREIVRYHDVYLGPEPLALHHAQSELLEFARQANPVAIRRLSELISELDPVAVDVSFDTQSLTIDLAVSGGTPGQTYEVQARNRADGNSITCPAHVMEWSTQGPRAVATFQGSSLASIGTWDFYAVTREGDVVVETLLRVARKFPRTPAGHRARLVLYPVRRPGYALVVVRRPHIALRALSKVVSRVRLAPKRKR
jgi:hypothetical protein